MDQDLTEEDLQEQAGQYRLVGERYFYGRGVEQSYDNAYDPLRNAAALGDAEAAFLLGRIYGEGLRSHRAKRFDYAAYWFEQAAKQGHAEAQYQLGVLHINKKLCGTFSLTKGAKLLTKAAKQGHREAQYLLGLLYLRGRIVMQSREEGMKWLRKAAKQGHEEAAKQLEKAKRSKASGDSPEIVELKARAKKGEAEAQYDLGMRFLSGKGVKQSGEVAGQWVRKAAEKGLAEAQYIYAKMLDCKISDAGFHWHHDQASNLFRKAAEQGYAPAQCALAERLYEGDFIRQSYPEALQWIQKAVVQDLVEAQYRLGMFHLEGRAIVPRNVSEAVHWIRIAAERGFPKAMEQLGLFYLNGTGVERSYSEAAQWFLKAVNHEMREAQYQLARLYSLGLGVEQSDEKAAKWYFEAASLNNHKAFEPLAMCYLEGRGIEKNVEYAAQYFEIEAYRGNIRAQRMLADLYARGEGVEQSNEEAARWREHAELGDIKPY